MTAACIGFDGYRLSIPWESAGGKVSVQETTLLIDGVEVPAFIYDSAWPFRFRIERLDGLPLIKTSEDATTFQPLAFNIVIDEDNSGQVLNIHKIFQGVWNGYDPADIIAR